MRCRRFLDVFVEDGSRLIHTRGRKIVNFDWRYLIILETDREA
jgi:hypothetical protein